MGSQREGETRGTHCEAGDFFEPSKARERIREAAQRALQRVSEFKPLKLKKPFTLRVEYIEPKYVEEKANLPGVTRLDEFTITKQCHGLEDVIL
ncbi:M55 family metallopeptidase [Candidatus Bathyarchaeota archaeon]|nr:M55 family metallopeptidase [Candidatus Bathyarchaeota archaeon]